MRLLIFLTTLILILGCDNPASNEVEEDLPETMITAHLKTDNVILDSRIKINDEEIARFSRGEDWEFSFRVHLNDSVSVEMDKFNKSYGFVDVYFTNNGEEIGKTLEAYPTDEHVQYGVGFVMDEKNFFTE